MKPCKDCDLYEYLDTEAIRNTIYQNIRSAVEDVLGDEVDKEQEAVVDSWAGNAFTSVLEQTPRWIKCSDRLPEPQEWVLVMLRDGWGKGVGFDNPQAVSRRYRSHWYGFSNNNVTHWMPLPAAPEVEG